MTWAMPGIERIRGRIVRSHRRAGGGDPGAVATLYDRHAAVLFPIALRILRDRAEAEDVLHDAFVLVGERAPQYSASRGTVHAWLVTMVRNLAIDRTRRRERRSVLAQADALERPAHAEPNAAPQALPCCSSTAM